MPTYPIYNIETGEAEEDFWGSYSALQEFLAANPHLAKSVTAPALISGIAGVTHKNDSGFNDMMSRIASANPTSPLAEKYGDKGIKASKTREAVNKFKKTASKK